MAEIPQDIGSQLRRDEGLRLKLYQDTTGNLTIGYGRNLTADGIRQSEAELMLENDISEASSQLSLALPWTETLDAARRAALVNACFNMGIRGLLSFSKALACMREGDWQGAHDDLLDSEWHAEVGPRAERIAQQILTGTWQ